MTTKKPDVKVLKTKATAVLAEFRRFSVFLFLGLVAVLYGFVLLRINILNSAQPTDVSVSNQVKAAQVPRIDQTTVKQLESLQSNNVNVQALFNEARSDPFQQQQQ